MNSVLSYPGQAYDYIHGQFGLIGVIIAGVVMVVGFVSLLIWGDRRK